ncbi:MAG: mycothiol system anti-sigma-R factor [Armatimonadetes bacterium 13_1_40CM_64_14]|nr:MAG: mycothiol system anti-sigma-R factor [Armatimonadetes bacterium 13_1_40CM_64_14]
MSEIDCEQVLQLVWQFLDGEVEEVRYREIEAHLAECANCEGRVSFERRLRTLIETKCQEGPVPVELKRRLFKFLEG